LDEPVITRVVTVAGGRFAPGGLGELTKQVPFEMVDSVLEQTCRVQRRARDRPARVVVYLLLAGCLLPIWYFLTRITFSGTESASPPSGMPCCWSGWWAPRRRIVSTGLSVTPRSPGLS
jgi:transposase IS4-like protein